MPNLMSYAPALDLKPPPAWTQADIAQKGGLANIGAGYQTHRLGRDMGRSLTDLVSNQAATGSFFGSGTVDKTQRITEAGNDSMFDIQYKLATTLADLTKSGTLAQIGVGL